MDTKDVCVCMDTIGVCVSVWILRMGVYLYGYYGWECVCKDTKDVCVYIDTKTGCVSVWILRMGVCLYGC